jgi:hypothetical protein
MLAPRRIRWAQCARLMKNYGSSQPNLEQRWKKFALSTLSPRVHPIDGELQAGDAIKNQTLTPRVRALRVYWLCHVRGFYLSIGQSALSRHVDISTH